MSLFTHNYSSIITKGLGNPACCSLIVSSFSLTGFCNIEIIIPEQPIGGGGSGGSISSGGFFVPLPTKIYKPTRTVLVTIKFTEQKSWRRKYIVSVDKADILVKVLNFGNTVKSNITVGVEHIKHITKQVVAMFNIEDK